MLSYVVPISFEIVGSSTKISLQLACRVSDAGHLQSQVKAYFPESVIKERTDLLEEIVSQGDLQASIRHYGLKDEFMRPLKMAGSFKPDPLIGLLGTLEHLHSGEYAVVQVLFQGTIKPWAESIMRSVTDSDGKSFFADAPGNGKADRGKNILPALRRFHENNGGKPYRRARPPYLGYGRKCARAYIFLRVQFSPSPSLRH